MQRFLSRAGIAASVLLVTACAGDRPLAPDLAAPSLSVGAASTTELSCAWNTLDQAAKALFSGNQDPVFTTISAMRTAYRNGDLSAATGLGFDALREAEKARGGSRIKNSAGGTQANNFTRAVFACTSHNIIPSNMDVAAAWNTGVYVVRGGDPASGDAQGAAKSIGTNPKFGAEAPNGWAGTLGNGTSRYLMWGFKSSNPFTGEPVTDAFWLETHPKVTFANGIRVGLCLDPVSPTGAARRLIHGKSSGATVGALSLVQFCIDPADFGALTQSSGFFATARRALALFAPQEAFAQLARGGVGTLESSLSPFGSFIVSAATTEITWVQEPVSGTKQGTVQSPPIAVDFLTNTGAPIAGITFLARIFNNNGQPSQTGSTGLEATTDVNGRATFSDLSIASPGAYILEIYSAATTEYLTSLRFNISP